MDKRMPWEEAIEYIRSKGFTMSEEEFERHFMEGTGPQFSIESPKLTGIKDAISWLEETLEEYRHILYLYEQNRDKGG